MRHVDALGAHFDHPGVFEHAPGGGAAGGFFFETVFRSLALRLGFAFCVAGLRFMEGREIGSQGTVR